MRVHITNLYGQSSASTAQKVQNEVAEIATKTLRYNQLGIYYYNVDNDSPEMLSARLDGIIASVSFGDIVIFQFPTWNGIRFDASLVGRLSTYRGLKKVFFLHDVPPLMFEPNRDILGQYIALYNLADMLILPSQGMADFLRAEGLAVEKIVVQRMWDFPVAIDRSVMPRFRRTIHFAGNPEVRKFAFTKDWSYGAVELAVTAEAGEWARGKNVRFLGRFNNDALLANALRREGGFGLVWSDDPYSREYMKINANNKLSAYLAAGIPVIVRSDTAERDTILRKNLGMAVDSLDEAVDRIAHMEEGEYHRMAADVDLFSELVREGYFTKKALTDAVFGLLYD